MNKEFKKDMDALREVAKDGWRTFLLLFIVWTLILASISVPVILYFQHIEKEERHELIMKASEFTLEEFDRQMKLRGCTCKCKK